MDDSVYTTSSSLGDHYPTFNAHIVRLPSSERPISFPACGRMSVRASSSFHSVSQVVACFMVVLSGLHIWYPIFATVPLTTTGNECYAAAEQDTYLLKQPLSDITASQYKYSSRRLRLV
ncbi:hypothetical protein ARMSODRAFT_444607 [Armillaria solidipes]|uniref:Transmembrane protein n=1 Tax=Armillaria solidipes TaxID=1076256 RepID=A0A2H3BKR2_9AGAR|nr:hypothetical protein ARMSODRAFT_444607 [Armillaria solidipes]